MLFQANEIFEQKILAYLIKNIKKTLMSLTFFFALEKLLK